MKIKALILTLMACAFAVSCAEDDTAGGMPSVRTLEATDITKSTALLRGETHGGVDGMLTRGVCFSTSEDVSFDDAKVSVIRGDGAFAVTTHGLDPMTQYFTRAFAVMATGEILYGETLSFTTSDFALPTLAISEPLEIMSTEVRLAGEIVDEGDFLISELGFVYSKTAGVALDVEGSMTQRMEQISHEFVTSLTNLEIGTKYYAKVYAVTERGVGYSEEISFETKNIRPVEFGELTISNVDYLSLDASTTIVNPHGEITARGFCWSSTQSLPSRSDNDVPIDLTSGEFAFTLNGLTPKTTVYVRAYAVNNTGVCYSAAAKAVTLTYNCNDGMVLVTPNDKTYIGWLGSPTREDSIFATANDGDFAVNLSADRSTTPTASVYTNMPAYQIAKYEVTNADFLLFLSLYGSTTIKDGDYAGEKLFYEEATRIKYDADTQTWSVDEGYENHPVVGVTWYAADAFCRFFGGYLPSEAQWENAARENLYSNEETMFAYSGSNDLAEVAVYNTTLTAEVGTKKANRLGLYDMSGNAQEWTSSWYGTYKTVYTEQGPNSTYGKCCRGGRCQRGLAASFRNCDREAISITGNFDANRHPYLGFRFACDADK